MHVCKNINTIQKNHPHQCPHTLLAFLTSGLVPLLFLHGHVNITCTCSTHKYNHTVKQQEPHCTHQQSKFSTVLCLGAHAQQRHTAVILLPYCYY